MSSPYAALSSDFYINARVNLKMDLPMRRDTVLPLFDRVRRQRPSMDKFRRYSNELALESRATERSKGLEGADLVGGGGGGEPGAYDWLAIRRTSIRSGSVNPDSDKHAHDLHGLILETCPYFLDVTPLDIESVEVLFGFDLMAAGNHDAIVFGALLGDSPLGAIMQTGSGPGKAALPIDFQPLLGMSLTEQCDVQAIFEVKTRTSAAQVRSGEYREEPISVYLIVRKHGPLEDVTQLPNIYHSLVARAEELLDRRVVPNMIVPLREAIGAG